MCTSGPLRRAGLTLLGCHSSSTWQAQASTAWPASAHARASSVAAGQERGGEVLADWTRTFLPCPDSASGDAKIGGIPPVSASNCRLKKSRAQGEVQMIANRSKQAKQLDEATAGACKDSADSERRRDAINVLKQAPRPLKATSSCSPLLAPHLPVDAACPARGPQGAFALLLLGAPVGCAFGLRRGRRKGARSRPGAGDAQYIAGVAHRCSERGDPPALQGTSASKVTGPGAAAAEKGNAGKVGQGQNTRSLIGRPIAQL